MFIILQLVYRIFIICMVGSVAKPLIRDAAEPVHNETHQLFNDHIIYDQSQTGKYNIQVVLKDVTLIQMDHSDITAADYADDYYYDEAQLTVKPIHLTSNSKTAKPTHSNKTGLIALNSAINSDNGKLTEDTTFPLNIFDTTQEINAVLTESVATESLLSRAFINSHSKVEPIYAIEDLKPLNRHGLVHLSQTHNKMNDTLMAKRKIHNITVYRAIQNKFMTRKQTSRCHNGKLAFDGKTCHYNSSYSTAKSILKRLLNVLATMAFGNEVAKP